MAGLLDFFTSGDQGSGLLGNLNDYAQNNQGALLGLGLGLMGGSSPQDAYTQAANGYMAGQRQDFARRQLVQKQNEEQQKRTAAQSIGQKMGLDPSIAQGDPDTVLGLYKAVQAQKLVPKELSFQERLYNALPDDQKATAGQALLGITKASGPTSDYNQRVQIAQSQGLKPGDPAYQSYVLTGKMPREDQAPLTATDKKAILEADEGVAAATNAIDALKKAKELSPKAYGGFGAGTLGTVTSAWGNEAGVATQELDNVVGTNALSQLKAIFGGNPTEGERAIMMELQGASSKPDAVRQKIYDRAIEMAQRRLAFNQQRANEMRGGTFYKSQSGQGAPQAKQPSAQEAIQVDGYTIRQR